MHPGFDFSHPVEIGDNAGRFDIEKPLEQFETLAHACVRAAVAGEDAPGDAPWVKDGARMLKALFGIGVDPGARNGQGFTCLDLTCILLGPHRWRQTHTQAVALETFLLDCLDVQIQAGAGINSHSRTTSLGAMLTEHDTPRDMLGAIASGGIGSTGVSDRVRSRAQAVLMDLGVGQASTDGRAGPRF